MEMNNKSRPPSGERPFSRGAVRKRRREKGAFAVSQRQSALTTTKGAGAAKPRRPRWGLRPAGRSAKRSGRTLVAPAAPAALFLALPSKSPLFLVRSSFAPGFWMKKAQRATPQALVAWGLLCVFYAPKSPGKTVVFLCHPGFEARIYLASSLSSVAMRTQMHSSVAACSSSAKLG